MECAQGIKKQLNCIESLPYSNEGCPKLTGWLQVHVKLIVAVN